MFKRARLKIALKYFKICENIKAENRTTEKMLAKARQDLVEEKKKSWKADCASRDLARKDAVIKQNNEEIELQAQQIIDLESDLKNALEEKQMLENKEVDTLVPT